MDWLGRLWNGTLRKYGQLVTALGSDLDLRHGSRQFRHTWGHLPLCLSGEHSGELLITLTLETAGSARAIDWMPLNFPLQSCQFVCLHRLLHKCSQPKDVLSAMAGEIHFQPFHRCPPLLRRRFADMRVGAFLTRIAAWQFGYRFCS
jgi:hypothetical protein